jgi:hypothetical protein
MGILIDVVPSNLKMWDGYCRSNIILELKCDADLCPFGANDHVEHILINGRI